jgi:hypothetical protein
MAVDPGGYPVPRYEGRRADIVVPQWQLRFGAGSNTASNTDDGLLIDVITALSQAADERGAEAYNSGFFNTAVGLQLDQLIGGFFGTKRAGDRSSVGPVIVYGESGTIISPAAAPDEIATADRQDLYTVAGPVELGFTNIAVFVFAPTTGVGTSTEITVNGVTYGPSLGVEGTGKAVAQNQWALMPSSDAQYSSKHDVFEDQDGNGVLVLTLNDLFNTTVTATASQVEQYRGTETLAKSIEPGAIQGDAYQLTVINTPVSGWIGVVNLEAVTLGATEDTDAQYRQRHLRTIAKGGTSTLIALKSILLDESRNPGVEYVQIYNNPVAPTDAQGRPGHSFEVVAEGGTDATLVDLIWENHPMGIQSYGLTTVTLVDERLAGDHLVSYTRPEKRYIWVDVVITAGEGFPSDPISDIQNEVATTFEAFGTALGVGRDVYIDEMLQALNIPGVSSVVIALGASSSAAINPGTAVSNLLIDDRQLSVWAVDRIQTVVNV